MNKKLSPIGYAIVFVLLLAVIMLVSSPVIFENYKGEPGSNSKSQSEKTKQYAPEQNDRNYRFSGGDRDDEISDLERRLNDRLDAIERSNGNSRYENTVTDKYICSIEGGLDESGVVVPIDPNNPPAKFVFACEYRH